MRSQRLKRTETRMKSRRVKSEGNHEERSHVIMDDMQMGVIARHRHLETQCGCGHKVKKTSEKIRVKCM